MEDNRLQEEKQTLSKWSYNPSGKIFGGIIVIWLGISFLLREHHYIRHGEWWAYFLLGLGIIFLVEAFVRMNHPDYHGHYIGRIVAGVILIAIGAAHIYNIEDWWPIILIALGVIIVILNLRQKQDTQKQETSVDTRSESTKK